MAYRNRLSRLLADLRPPADPVFYSLSTFYREEFVKCQRCLDEQREYYSESAICDVELLPSGEVGVDTCVAPCDSE